MVNVTHRLIYHGRVQGVGFRYTTASLARRFPVQGYVKNLPNGTVEVLVDGSEAEVRAFLDEIASSFAGSITDCDREEVEPGEVFREFRIRY